MFYIFQILNDDCGYASLKTLLANLFKKEEYLYLPQDEEHGPYSYQQLIEIGQTYGVHLSGVKIEGDELNDISPYPFLATISREGDSLHMVYVYKVMRKKVKVFDPEQGLLTISLDDFISMWDHTALVVEEYEEITQLEKVDEGVSLKEKIIIYLLELFSFASLITGVMFIDKDTKIYIPIIGFSLYIVFELVLQKYLVTLMSRLDERYLSTLSEIPKNPKSFLLRFEEFKKNIFVTPMHFIMNCVTVVFLALIMVLNNSYNALIVMATLLLTIIYYFLIIPMQNKKKISIAKEENNLLGYSDVQEFVVDAHKLHEEAYKYTMIDTAIKYVSYFLIGVTTIISMILSNLVSVPFVLIYGLFGFTIFDRLIKIVSFPKEIEENKKQKATLYSSFKRIGG